MSPVLWPFFIVCFIAVSIALAAFSSLKECLSIIAVERIWAIGLAMPFPAMSGAEPPEGSYRFIFGPKLAEPSIPRLPGRMLVRSLIMSPNRFGQAITSNLFGSFTRSWTALSMYRFSSSTSGWFFDSSSKTSRQSLEVSNTLALSIEVSLFFLCFAVLNANFATCSIVDLLYSATSFASSFVGLLCSPK